MDMDMGNGYVQESWDVMQSKVQGSWNILRGAEGFTPFFVFVFLLFIFGGSSRRRFIKVM